MRGGPAWMYLAWWRVFSPAAPWRAAKMAPPVHSSSVFGPFRPFSWKPLLTHFKNILDLVSSFSGSHFKIMDQWTYSHEILHHFCVLWSLWTWIASSWHLCYVVFLDWPRSFPRKWWNLVSLCVYILLYLAVCTLSYSVGKHPPTDKLLTDLNKH